MDEPTDPAARRPSLLLAQALERCRRESETAERQALEARRVAEDLELRVREVDHRAKNSLQLAAAMLRMQGRASDDPRLAAQLQSATTRLQTLADIHAALYRSTDHDTVAMRPWLTRVGEGLGLRDKVAIRIEAPNVTWPVTLAAPVGLFAAEGLANALKHAFSDAGGRVEIRLEPIEDNLWRLSVADDGDGLPTDAPRGLGLKLLGVFAKQVKGEIAYTPGLDGRGLGACMTFFGPGPDE